MKKLISVFLALFFVSSNVYAGDIRERQDAYKRGDYQTVEEKWQPMAEQGNAEAQYQIGMIYNEKYQISGHPSDQKSAFKWLKMAHKGGHEDALSKVNLMITQSYKNGLEAYQRGDYQTAEKNLKNIAERGHVGAQYHLGMMNKNWPGREPDYNKAFKWLKRAAAQNPKFWWLTKEQLDLIYREGTDDYSQGDDKRDEDWLP